MDSMVLDAVSPADSLALTDPHAIPVDVGVDRLRIALIAPPYFDIPPMAYVGVEAVVADLADSLVEQGHHVTLIAAGRNGTKAEFIPLWDEPLSQRLGEPFPEVAHAAAARRAVARLAERDGLDVVHDHTLAGPLNAPFYRSLGLPTVITAHGPVTGDLRRLYRSLGREIFLVAISARQRALAPELNWVGTVHNAVRVETFPYQATKGDYALFLGRFHPEKGAASRPRRRPRGGHPARARGQVRRAARTGVFRARSPAPVDR